MEFGNVGLQLYMVYIRDPRWNAMSNTTVTKVSYSYSYGYVGVLGERELKLEDVRLTSVNIRGVRRLGRCFCWAFNLIQLMYFKTDQILGKISQRCNKY